MDFFYKSVFIIIFIICTARGKEREKKNIPISLRIIE